MSKGQTAKKKSDSGKKTRRPNSGSFKKGNTIGAETRFKEGNTIGKETRAKEGNTLATTYSKDYPDTMLEYAKREDVIYPSLEGWCMENGVFVRTAYDWLDSHPRFADAYDQLKSVQKQRLEERGLTNRYNANIVKFLLENNHGMREKSETEVKGDSTFTVNIREVD